VVAIMTPVSLPGVVSRGYGTVVIACTSRAAGDFALGSADVDRRRAEVTHGLPVLFPQQVHGRAVLAEGSAEADEFLGGRWRGALVVPPPSADAVVATSRELAIAVVTADCAPVALWTDDAVIGVVHAGWRGLLDGVVETTAEEVRSRSARPDTLKALLGPCIGPCCYEFGTADLDRLARVYGDQVRARTTAGTESLDLWAGVRAALVRAGATFEGYLSFDGLPACTACNSTWFSWRRDHDRGRQAMFVWTVRADGM
jgi:polyphenol oxidase